eukprot:2764983-Amphidinium_carterae.1
MDLSSGSTPHVSNAARSFFGPVARPLALSLEHCPILKKTPLQVHDEGLQTTKPRTPIQDTWNSIPTQRRPVGLLLKFFVLVRSERQPPFHAQPEQLQKA